MRGLNEAIEYMETHLNEDISVNDVARSVYMSSHYFQKGFQILTGYSVMEYIRNRRLAEAGVELAYGDKKVIDIALEYGYDTPESFTKAFRRFHGISPSQAKKNPRNLKRFQRLHVKIILEGGSNMEYRIETKKESKVYGVKRTFSMENSYQEIPKFWDEYMASNKDKEDALCGMYGICYDAIKDGKHFDYYIADDYNGQELPEGYEILTLPETTWAVFPCHGPMPSALQSVNTQIFSEWFPAHKEYDMLGDISVEYYSEGDPDSPEYYSEIWVQVCEK